MLVLTSLDRVVALGVGLTAVTSAGGAYWHSVYNAKIASERFDALTARTVGQINHQIGLYQYGLRGARGSIVAAGEDLSHARFERYSSTRDPETEFPGARGFGFAKIVPRGLTASFIESARREGRPGFSIRELGDVTDSHFVVEYIEPEGRNAEAIGLDIASEVRRRTAAIAAMDSGEARLTAPLTLVQASGQQDRGVLMLLPVYRYGEPTETTAQRRSAAIGWTFAPLVIDDVVAAMHVLSDEFALSITDTQAKDTLPFYATTNAVQTGTGLIRHARFEIYGRDWDVETHALPPFLARLNLIDPALTGLAVLVVGLLLTALLHLHLAGLSRRESAWRQRSRLAAIVAESSEAIMAASLSGEVTDWNPAAERLFGYPASEALGRNLSGLIVPEQFMKEREDATREMLETGATVRLVTQRRSRDDKLLDMVVNLSPIRSEDGAVVGIGTSAQDVTSYVTARREVESLNASLEQQVVARTAELKAITNAIPSMIAYWDKDLRCGFANNAYREWFGRDPDTMIGASMADFLGETLFASNEPFVRAALAGQRQNFERSLTKADGTIGHTWANYVPHLDHRGEVLGFFVLVTDVTPLRQAELRVEASEARYRLLAENSSDMIFQLDRDLVRRYVSPASLEILGYEAAEIIGTRPIGQVHPDDAERLSQSYRSLLDGTADNGAIINRIRHRDGHWVWVEATLRALRDPLTGNVVGIVGALRDITARKTIEVQLEAAKQVAEDASRIKSEFLATMSHELRTPLNGIIGFSRLILESRTPRDSVTEHRIRLIHGASKTLLAIVNDVLDVSKLEADRLDLDIRGFNVRSLINSTLELLRQDADARNLGLRADIAADVPGNLCGDDNRLRQILMNLVSNALKFTGRGGVVVTVSEQSGDSAMARLRVSVRDTGIGIPESARPRIFQKFSQVDGTIARSYGGTGLGLSICKRLVELMGGVIDFDSKEGEGSEFWFEISLPVAAHGANQTIAGEDAAESVGPTANILLAEDNPLNQELALSIIGRWGHRIDVVSNGAEAVDAVRRKDYDIILMDVHMPVMDGVEATTRIRALGGAYATMPIIAMTAAVLVDQVDSFREAGMSDHIGKPFEPDKLRRMIDRWIANGTSGAGPSDEHRELSTGESMTVPLAPEIPHEAVESEILDEAVYADLSAMIGDEKAANIARQFAEDLAGRFADATNQKAVRTDAHIVISSAGALGFRNLSACARDLEEACDDGGDVSGHLRELMDRRRQVIKFIGEKFELVMSGSSGPADGRGQS